MSNDFSCQIIELARKFLNQLGMTLLDLIADYSGNGIALRKLAEIEETINSLASAPHRGTIRNEIYQGLRAIPTARKGVVCFVVDDEARAVEIVAIAYAGADWAAMLKNR